MAETRDFDRAVGAAMDYADAHPGTLVVVTADHETSGLSITSNETDFTLSDSGVGYHFGTTRPFRNDGSRLFVRDRCRADQRRDGQYRAVEEDTVADGFGIVACGLRKSGNGL